MLILYGIPNCDSCRAARKWLESQDIDYRFHDLRVDGVTAGMLDRWLASVEWQTLLNTRSTTWRGLDEAEKSHVDQVRAKRLLLEHPTLIKRPVAEAGKLILVGYSPDRFVQLAG